jgi:hypothetical protein
MPTFKHITQDAHTSASALSERQAELRGFLLDFDRPTGRWYVVGRAAPTKRDGYKSQELALGDLARILGEWGEWK